MCRDPGAAAAPRGPRATLDTWLLEPACTDLDEARELGKSQTEVRL